jgi:Zn-dependent peptidase ImmA (M78 family)
LTLDSSEIQGFAISNDYAPFIFINSKDWGAAQLFTLVHELAHIWIAQTGISNDIESINNLKGVNHPVEAFCNEVAANALIPLEYISDIRNHITTPEIVYQYSRKLGVSSYAFMIRALKVNLISIDEYSILKAQAEAGFQEYLEKEKEKKAKQKEKDGGPSPYLLRLNKNGRLFTQIVLDAYKGGFVDPNIASFLLNTPTNKFPKLEAQLYK